MNRISKRLQQLQAEGKKALVTYIVNGDPNPEATLPAMHALVAAGADIIELGVPFSDPMAEGPVIQRGHERALAHNTSLRDTIALVRAFRQRDQNTPVVLMGYANPVERLGYARFAALAGEAGVDGLLTVDLPAAEAGELSAELRANGIENIFLLAPTTTEARIGEVAALAGGFLYYVSLKGVTGAGHLDAASVAAKLSDIRGQTALPLLVGFGIKDAASAAAIGALAEGVVVGSVLVSAMGEEPGLDSAAINDKLTAIVAPMRRALNELS